jgi:predicted Rossmann fold nucleotide-binding protein DprA/Smf involved in DNA uptake
MSIKNINKIMYHHGNFNIFNQQKTAFLCSRKIPASVVLKCYDWAIEQREIGNCIISGFHSQIEKDVFHYLLKGSQPIIIALARGLKENIEPELIKPLQEGRILIISPFDKTVKRVTEQTAEIRNKMMIELADNIIVGYTSEGGKLESILKTTEKEIIRLV